MLFANDVTSWRSRWNKATRLQSGGCSHLFSTSL